MKTQLSTDELDLLAEAKTKGPLGKARIYAKLSGPGWLQGCVSLGSASMAGALYLGVLFGPHMLWLQPLAMICGVIMLSAITYVTLSTGERPFGLVGRRVSPVLAWAWLIAAAIANIIFALPQFSLALAAVQQNLFPSTAAVSPYLITFILFAGCAVFVGIYNRGGRGIWWFDFLMKAMVGVIVFSFIGVVITLIAKGTVNFGELFKGLVPSLTYFTNPTPVFSEAIAQTGDHAETWTEIVTKSHGGVMITAFGTAVGVNMTFLLPYSMLKRNWSTGHRGLAIFDLSVGLFVPFVVATGCLVIAASTQFHGRTSDVLDESGRVRDGMAASYQARIQPMLNKLVAEGKADSAESARALLTPADHRVAAMLANRDAGQLATALEPLTGKFLAQKIFGIGVLAMAISTIVMLMVINGFIVTEAFGKPASQPLHYLGAAMPGIVGMFAPVIWTGSARVALAIPASMIASSLIPIAYFTFILLMNSRAALGPEMPAGRKRVVWNLLMITATVLVSAGTIWVTRQSISLPGLPGIMATACLILLAVLFILGIAGFLKRSRQPHP
jgi:Mn2+/Fe2+ NRAMP family transporter